MFETDCPNCGAEDSLRIVTYTASCDIPLFGDGFSETDSSYMETSDEVVRCSNCRKYFDLCNLIVDDDDDK